jgi:hypothetical protein
VRSELFKGHRFLYRDAVIQYVQIASLEVYDPVATGILDIGVSDIPFLGNGPVKHRRSARHLVHFKSNRTL